MTLSLSNKRQRDSLHKRKKRERKERKKGRKEGRAEGRKEGVLIVAQQKRIRLGTIKLWVPSLASLSGLRTQL